MTEAAPSPLKETLAEHRIVALGIVPGMDPDLLETVGNVCDSLILIADRGGGVPHDLHGTIRALTEAGKSIFVVPENQSPQAHDQYGTIHITGQPLANAITNGAINLEKANSSHVPEVTQAISEAAAAGLTGSALAERMREQFCFAPGERPARRLASVEGRRAAAAEIDDELRKLGLGGIGTKRAAEELFGRKLDK